MKDHERPWKPCNCQQKWPFCITKEHKRPWKPCNCQQKWPFGIMKDHENHENHVAVGKLNENYATVGKNVWKPCSCHAFQWKPCNCQQKWPFGIMKDHENHEVASGQRILQATGSKRWKDNASNGQQAQTREPQVSSELPRKNTSKIHSTNMLSKTA